MNARLYTALGSALVSLAALVTAEAAGSAPRPVIPVAATEISGLPATVTGVANAHQDKDAPVPRCTTAAGVQWYTVRAPRRGALAARLIARGQLDGAIVVYRIVRSQRMPVVCAATNRHGRARVAWYAYREGSYLIGVARRQRSAVGPYELTVLASEPAEKAPGPTLPTGGVTGTINGVLDKADAWAVSMNRGTTYRINLTSPSKVGCIGYAVYRPNTSFAHSHPVAEASCGGYSEFTPGFDGGGTYSVLVTTDQTDPLSHAYRLEVAAAGADDTAPGVRIENGQLVSGSLFARGIDALDMYRFMVPRQNELTTVELRQKANIGFDLLIVSETGGRMDSIREGHGRQILRMHLASGRYYAIVRSRGKNGGRYQLQLRVRDVTSTTISAAGVPYLERPPSTPIPITVHVTHASHGGRVILEVDQFDPIVRWHYATSITGSVNASGTFTTSWLPPTVGQFRVRARFVANPYSSLSESGYVRLHVAEPLE